MDWKWVMHRTSMPGADGADLRRACFPFPTEATADADATAVAMTSWASVSHLAMLLVNASSFRGESALELKVRVPSDIALRHRAIFKIIH